VERGKHRLLSNVYFSVVSDRRKSAAAAVREAAERKTVSHLLSSVLEVTAARFNHINLQ